MRPNLAIADPKCPQWEFPSHLEQNGHIFKKKSLKEFLSEQQMATNKGACAAEPSHYKSEMPSKVISQSSGTK